MRLSGLHVIYLSVFPSPSHDLSPLIPRRTVFVCVDIYNIHIQLRRVLRNLRK